MKKIFMGALCAIALTSCHEDGLVRTTEINDVETAVIHVDRKTFEHMKEGCTPREVFYCEECQTWHILFDEYDYND